jgi:hypothetical protein
MDCLWHASKRRVVNSEYGCDVDLSVNCAKDATRDIIAECPILNGWEVVVPIRGYDAVKNRGNTTVANIA